VNGPRAAESAENVIQWFPGHMAAAMRRIGEYVRLVDVVVEAVDARVPQLGTNPALDAIVGGRPRLLVLTRSDLADPRQTARWLRFFEAGGRCALAVDARDQQSVVKAAAALERLAPEAGRPHRAMVVGVPNSGKSSIINGLARRSAARTEDRAGVTRALQWFRVGPRLELMDTPGILVPRIPSKEAQWKLAIVGAVPRDRYDPQDVALRLHRWLLEQSGGQSGVPDPESFARARGFIRKGGEPDHHNAAQSYIKDFNEGKFGRITLEPPPNDAKSA
jgi:ribosome biogenesis GTPase A